MAERRKRTPPWKHIYGVDRKYTARVDRAKARGQYTAPKPDKEAAALSLDGPR